MASKYSDYDHILGKNAIDLSPGAISSLRTQIDAEIKELNNRLQYLLAVRNCLAPVHRLPHEILSKIFDLVRVGEDGRVLVKRILPASWVSQHWRDVALGNPFLWDHIDRSNCRWAIWCLIRSKNAPLFVYISYEFTRTISTTTMDTLLRELPRIQELKMGGKDSEEGGRSWGLSHLNHTEYEAPKFTSLASSTFTLLQTLRLTAHNTGDRFSSLEMPYLAHLKITSSEFTWNEFMLPSLKTLSIDHPRSTISPTNLLQLLSRMPLLEEITLIRALSEDSEFSTEFLSIHCPRLRLITLFEYQANILVELARNITIPPDASLTMSTEISGNRVEEGLRLFFPIARQRFTSLSLDAVDISKSHDKFSLGFGQREIDGVRGNTIIQATRQSEQAYNLNNLVQVIRNFPLGGVGFLRLAGYWNLLGSGSFDDFSRLLGMMPNVEELLLEDYAGLDLLRYLSNSPTTSLHPSLRMITFRNIYDAFTHYALTNAQIEGLVAWRKGTSIEMILKDPDPRLKDGRFKRLIEAAFDEVYY
ncbi:hypothetical protein BDN72DRAFT_843918 [Pluteus cervinus]|uniref:Uncharacterized protein n=1 Tax=Pluteus cervinus TaxID=181527 RepID=A0ACD3AL71_9AGAR|nr:hypothetical protein BDN72DRAFT_843918 [Pluteus cervinus]